MILMSKRKPNFSDADKLFVATEFAKYRDILASRHVTTDTNRRKQEIWHLVTAGLNLVNPNVQRNYEEVRKKWENMVCDTKRRYAERKFHLLSGGNTSGLSPWEPWQEKVIRMFEDAPSWCSITAADATGFMDESCSSSQHSNSDNDVKPYSQRQTETANDEFEFGQETATIFADHQQLNLNMMQQHPPWHLPVTTFGCSELRPASAPSLPAIDGVQQSSRKRTATEFSSEFEPRRKEETELRLLEAEAVKSELTNEKLRVEVEVLQLKKAKLELELQKMRSEMAKSLSVTNEESMSTTITQGSLKISVVSNNSSATCISQN